MLEKKPISAFHQGPTWRGPLVRALFLSKHYNAAIMIAHSASRPPRVGLQSVDLRVATAPSSARIEGRLPYCYLQGSLRTPQDTYGLARESQLAIYLVDLANNVVRVGEFSPSLSKNSAVLFPLFRRSGGGGPIKAIMSAR